MQTTAQTDPSMIFTPARQNRSRLLQAACLAALTCAPAFAQQELKKDRQEGAASVTIADVQEWLGTLAGPEFEGRGTGQDGYGKAAAYVAEHFRSLGLEARGEEGSYYQHLPWDRTTVTGGAMRFRPADGGEPLLTIPMDRMSGTATQDTDARGTVLLLNVEIPEGNGRRRGGSRIEGLEDLDIDGRFVVVHTQATGRRAAFARYSILRELQGGGAAAVVFATTEPVSGGLTGNSGMSRRGGNPAAAASARRPIDVNIGGADFAKLLESTEYDADSIGKAPLATELELVGEIEVETESSRAPAMNVWAVLPGSDPKLADEYVVIGSHLDHLGRRGDTLYPGADDDGSGTTGVLAVAQMFAKNPVKPKRSVLFVCFAGEERGLLGSGFFADNPPIPLSSIAAELQMDMIGRDEEESRDGGRQVNVGETAEDNKNVVHLVGTQKLSSGLHELCMRTNEAAGFDIEFDQESLFTRSDHANFAYKGVPIAFFFTGIHKDYHQPTDTPDKINYPKLLRIARWVYDIGFELASDRPRPTVDRELWDDFRNSQRRRSMPEDPAAPVTGG